MNEENVTTTHYKSSLVLKHKTLATNKPQEISDFQLVASGKS